MSEWTVELLREWLRTYFPDEPMPSDAELEHAVRWAKR